MNFEQIIEVERERVDRDFEIAKKDTEEGRRMRIKIDKICWDYTHR